MCRAFGAVHGKNSARLEAHLIRQSQYSLAKFSFFERLEFVEPWCDEGGEDDDHQQLKPADKHERPNPPKAAGRLHEPENDEEKRNADHQAENQAFEFVGKVELRRYLVEAEPGFESEGRVKIGHQAGDSEIETDGETENNAPAINTERELLR